GLAAEHVTELGGLVINLVEADAEEVAEHQLGHGPEAGHGRPGGGAHDGRFGDRRVDHAGLAELAAQTLGDAQHAATGRHAGRDAGAARDVLADDHDALIALHFLAQGFVQRLAYRFRWHRALLSRRCRRRGAAPLIWAGAPPWRRRPRPRCA